MSIPVPITKSELRKIKRELRRPVDFVCCDPESHVKVLLVAREMLMRGEDVKAKIKLGHEWQNRLDNPTGK